MYSVYKHTAPNGKSYIGVTCRPLKKRFVSGNGYKRNPAFFADILKYGWNQIKHAVLFECQDKEEAEKKEAEMIAAYNTTDERYGYNLRKGGSSYGFNDVARRRMKAAHVGKVLPEDQKNKISAALKGRKTSRGTLGCKYSAESCEKISKALKEHYKHAESHIIGAKNPKARGVINLTTGKRYATIAEAQRDCGIKTHTGICNACKGLVKSAGGYKWKYAESEGVNNG